MATPLEVGGGGGAEEQCTLFFMRHFLARRDIAFLFYVRENICRDSRNCIYEVPVACRGVNGITKLKLRRNALTTKNRSLDGHHLSKPSQK